MSSPNGLSLDGRSDRGIKPFDRLKASLSYKRSMGAVFPHFRSYNTLVLNPYDPLRSIVCDQAPFDEPVNQSTNNSTSKIS